MNFDFTFGKSPATNPPTPETPFRILVLVDLDGRGSRNQANLFNGGDEQVRLAGKKLAHGG